MGYIFWDELNNINDDVLLEMANLRGKEVKIEDIDFSIFFSRKYPNHGCRIKICWNRDKMTHDTGNMEAHGDYKYTQDASCKYKPDSYEISTARYFIKRYKVLFAAVWEEKLDPNDLIDYFRGRLTWKQLLKCFMNVNDIEYNMIQLCDDRKELEKCVRVYEIFNMND